MGIKIDINAKDLKTLLALLLQYLPNTLVWAFGSRVKFTAKPTSDLDLVAFITGKQKMSFSLLKEALAESSLPFRVDLHDWNDIPENFRKNIEDSYLVIQDVANSEVPNNWKIYTLGKDVVSKLGDGLHGTPIYDDNGEYYFINGSNLVAGKIVINSNTKKVSEEEFIKYKKELSERTILLGINGTIGNVALYNKEKCILGKSAAYLNINDDFDKNFVRYVLTNEHFQNYIKNNASGTTIKNVGLGLLREYEFLAPEDKTEQSKIAQILSSLDNKIELNLQMNHTLEAMAQALFKEWFVDFKFPGFDGVLVDGLPKGWKMGKLSSVCQIKYGKDHKHLGDGKIPVYGSGGIMRYADKALFEQESILIPRKGSLSNLFYVSKPFWSVDTMFYTIIKQESIRKYLFYLLNSLNLASMNVGSAVPSLTTEVLNKIEIIIPDDKILLEFEKIISSFYTKMDGNNNQNQSLSETRDSILPKLMSGQLKIN